MCHAASDSEMKKQIHTSTLMKNRVAISYSFPYDCFTKLKFKKNEFF